MFDIFYSGPHQRWQQTQAGWFQEIEVWAKIVDGQQQYKRFLLITVSFNNYCRLAFPSLVLFSWNSTCQCSWLRGWYRKWGSVHCTKPQIHLRHGPGLRLEMLNTTDIERSFRTVVAVPVSSSPPRLVCSFILVPRMTFASIFLYNFCSV